MNPLLSRVRKVENKTKIRAYSSISISNDHQNIKLPPVSVREIRENNDNQRARSLSAYQLLDCSLQKMVYKGQKLNKLSSKIDFFNPQNQRKLDLSRRNILKNVGAQPFEPKPQLVKIKRRHNLTPALHILVNQFLRKKQQDQQKQGEYMVIGSKNNLLYY